MAPFRLENYLIIQPGSEETLVQFGLSEETFYPPNAAIPTKVYRNGSQFCSTGSETDAVYPIQNGSIVDVAALCYFLKLVYRSILSTNAAASNVPLMIVSHPSWTHSQIENVTHYVFETLEINTMSILPSPLAVSFAFGSHRDCLVVDIGENSTTVSCVNDYQVVKYVTRTAAFGGSEINKALKRALPEWSAEQIEFLKCHSGVYEVLSNEDKKNEFGDNFEEEGYLDVAQIVNSAKDTKDILAQAKGTKKQSAGTGDSVVYVDASGAEVTIGKERFLGTQELIARVSQFAGKCVSKLQDFNKRQLCWDNVLVVGNTSQITGFKEALIAKLAEDHVVSSSGDSLAFTSTSTDLDQIPSGVKLGKFPEYFPEWKKHGYGEVSFLGAQIVSKQIFGHNNESMFVSRHRYNEKGPLAVWDIQF